MNVKEGSEWGGIVTNDEKLELEGITLNVYWYVVKEGKPVGPRDTMKGVNLSSPSVAYRHLQKLEDLGLLQKDEYGEYVVKRKLNMRGFVWVGRRFVSKMFLYALIFMSVLILEIVILVIHFGVEDYQFKVLFTLLIIVTGVAMGLFVAEGFMQRRRLLRGVQNSSHK
ncbi:MAG: hypothetical protein NWF00_10820 [Candidatus Bathyarchaeota archaeon]|nr:hypothetical protein [Candidatus Bathyarchaeota archaeon]